MFTSIVRARAVGEQVRIAERLPLKLLIVDRELAFVPLAGAVETAGSSVCC